MTLNWKHALVIGAILSVVPGLARAHELTCDNTVNGRERIKLDEFPTTVTYQVRIDNVHPELPSVVASFRDSISSWDFDPAPPFAIPVGGHVQDQATLSIEDYGACLKLAASDGRRDRYIDNRARVKWELGETQCSSRIECKKPKSPPSCEPGLGAGTGGEECPPPPCDGEEPTQRGGDENDEECPVAGPVSRTAAYYALHKHMLELCLVRGPFYLAGMGRATTPEELLGFLWGNPYRFPGTGPLTPGTERNEFERHRFLLAQQTLAAICNPLVFDNTISDPPLVQHALYELDLPYTCDADYLASVSSLTERLAALNAAGASAPLPPGFDPGPLNPLLWLEAEDITTPDGMCPRSL